MASENHIQAAAIRYKKPDTGLIVEVFGKSYEEIYELLGLQGESSAIAQWHEEGYLAQINENHIFIDKVTATGIAKEEGIKIAGERLDPSDIWKN